MSFSTNDIMPSFRRPASTVVIRRVSSYEAELTQILRETLRELSFTARDKVVLLKPNFVEPDPDGIVNTHPAVLAAAREAFLSLGARRVMVGEGPGHERDTEAILETIRLRDYLGDLQRNFVDLNLDDVELVSLRTRASKLRQMYFPKAVLQADLVVSMPKMKTHHWVGATLSLKNMFGIVPGSCYGWPKNVLHWAGISRSVLDINATVRPDLAIVDGIVGMEGNGPIQGTAKHSGVLVVGTDPVAVDATCARVMSLAPERIEYLAQAATVLGHIREDKIEQRGEAISSVRTTFDLLPAFARLRLEAKTFAAVARPY
jgi:uncharacterized protein (DUF362 family)